jgi:predicted DNA-binding protein with PD1-like motif
MKIFTFRLKPGQDLDLEIKAFVKKHTIHAGCILCAVGSLTDTVLRLANRDDTTHTTGHFEIVSITGTVSINGSHIHLAISDGDGRTTGGHLVPGCVVYTTAEIVLASFSDVEYRREFCAESGYDELVVVSR